MKLLKVFFILSVLTGLYACPRKEVKTAAIPAQPAFKLRQMIVRDSPIAQRTIRFEYDSKNRLIRRSIVEGNRSLETFVYKDDELVTVVTYDANGAETFSNDRPLYLLDNGSRLRFNLDRRTSASARETYRAHYRLENAQVTEIESSFTSVSPESYKIEGQYFTYDQGQNLLEYSKENDNQLTVKYEVAAVDAYKNPFRELSLLVNVFGELPNFSGMGTHNVTSMYHNGVLREFEYTYNAANYPVSIRDKGESFNRYEFVYEN